MPQEARRERTVQFRDFAKGMNQTSARTALRDDELFFLENVQPIGAGQLLVVPPPAPSIATLAGIATLWGITIKLAGVETARLVTVNNDGSMTAVNPLNGATTPIATAGTVTTKARLTMWQDTPLLIGDLTNGYFSWDGATLNKYPLALTGNTTNGSAVITSVAPNTTGLIAAMHLLSANFPAGTTIKSVDSGTQLTASANATATTTGVAITIGAGAPTSVADIATFEGRAFLVSASRAITLTAPASFTDFQTADGALTTTITDSVFAGQITRLLSALEVLWTIGPAAVNAISNVQLGTGNVTTLSNTNIVANVGTLLPSSVSSFFRTFLMLAPYGVYAIVGATPQKLSEQLDGLFPNLSFGSDQPSGIVSINRVFVWCVLVTFTDPATNVGRPVLLCFSRNAWFIGSQGSGLTWIASLVNLTTGVPELWGTDGTNIFKCFAGTTPGAYTIKTKLYDFGAFTQKKQLLRIAIDIQNPGATVNLTATATNEFGLTNTIPLNPIVSVLMFVGTASITFIGGGSVAIVWTIASVSVEGFANIAGDYIGLTLSGASLPFTISGIAMNIEWLGEWT